MELIYCLTGWPVADVMTGTDINHGDVSEASHLEGLTSTLPDSRKCHKPAVKLWFCLTNQRI
jgi:hypothetical protein